MGGGGSCMPWLISPLSPQFLGLHSHSATDSHADHAEEEDRTHIWKLLAVLGGIYAFFIMESLFNILMADKVSLNHWKISSECHFTLGMEKKLKLIPPPPTRVVHPREQII